MPVSEPHPMSRERVVAKVQYIKDLSFEVPRAAALHQAIRLPPALEIRLDVQSAMIAAIDRTYEVILTVRVAGRDTQVPTAHPQSIEFIAEIRYGGLFSLSEIPSEDTEEALAVDCPHTLYPFACAILADLSRDSNFAPIALEPVDFASLWQGRQPGEPREFTL